MGKKKFKGVPLQQGRTVILFDVKGDPLEAPTGSRQQQRTEMRRREKEMARVLQEHDAQVVDTVTKQPKS